ncbi:P-type cation-transporting ATPase [Catenaria anguillulae PL171]|uniref:P-type cation-transporting ATPase n=1 Tax=Catenaria anguillulae PL171 TaxID=765915 RepID=A0A1Y2HI79_9FUNG|nr:P-type cation-transporting ATPase [Catenaria anguillulae PL171]
MGKKQEKKSVALDEHKLTLDEICDRYKTAADPSQPASSPGLTPEEAARRLAADGPNQMSPAKTTHPFIKFIEHLLALFNLLLLVAGGLTLILYFVDPEGNASNIYAGPILLGVAFLNAFIEFYMGAKSEAALRTFMNMIPAKATAIRGGKLVVLPASDLVKGDVVFVRMGDKTPADVRLFKTQDMKVDNSSLTGESEPQDRVPTNTHDTALEATNLAFNSTLVVSGEGYGIVIRTGDDTVIGQIANLTQSEKKRKSPLTEEIESFVKFIGSLAGLTAIIFFIVAQVKTSQIGISFNFAIGVLVAWVPQGLPGTVTMLLTIAAKRMAQQQVLVKDLTGVETLGSITLLATDKTGTLTRNQMTVSNIWTHFKTYALLADSRTLQDGEVAFDSSVTGVQDILNISALCSRARFDKSDVPMDQREIIGDATETGLFRLATQKIRDFDSLAGKFPKVLELPFNSDTKWHMTIHKMPHANGVYTTFIKGAPERVLRICSTILDDKGAVVPLTEEHKVNFNTAYEHMASKGHRVLAFAKFELPGSEYPESHEFVKEQKNFPMSGLTFVGLSSLEDPPKHGVREAVGHCRRAGIKVTMVTGDHPLTAEAIGRKINLMISDTKEKMAKRLGVEVDQVPEEDVKAIVIHGEKIDSLTEEDWDLIFSKEEIIFARTSPKHKLQIVKRAQSMGHIVGVTGDGVNDSPALKKADLGIAMNISGSDVSKEAAAMILMDDNFASIINGIREGRLIFSNLKKSLRYVLVHSIPEVMPQLLFVIVPLPVGIGVLPILAIDLGYELFAALSFAWELPESEGLMKLQPRRPVNADSVDYLRARRAFDNQFKLATGDDEDDDDERELTFRERLRRYTSGEYWSRWFFSRDHGERMVDGDSLSWMYLESGVIQYIGAQVTFFVVFYYYYSEELKQYLNLTPTDLYLCASFASDKQVQWGHQPCPVGGGRIISKKDQEEALAQAQGAWYLSIVLCQLFNLFACKTSFTSPFRRYIFKNVQTYKTLTAGLLFAFGIVYIPGLCTAFGLSNRLNPLFLLIPIGFGIVTFLYAGLRHWIKMRLSPVKFTPEPLGLQMHATRYSHA